MKSNTMQGELHGEEIPQQRTEVAHKNMLSDNIPSKMIQSMGQPTNQGRFDYKTIQVSEFETSNKKNQLV